MGWGCNEHEVDAGSDAWKQKMDTIISEQEKAGWPTWGRDDAICPWCWEETARRLADLTDLLRQALALIEIAVPEAEGGAAPGSLRDRLRAALGQTITKEGEEHGPQ